MPSSLYLDDPHSAGPVLLARRIGRRSLAAVLDDPGWTRGLWLQLLGAHDEAIPCLEAVLAGRADPLGWAVAATHLLPSYLAVSRTVDASRLASEASATFARSERTACEAYARSMGALADQELGRLDAAGVGLEAALDRYRSLGLVRETTVVSGYLGELALERGERATARAWLERAVVGAKELGDPSLAAWLSTSLAACALAIEEAIANLLEAVGAIGQVDGGLHELVTLRYGHVELLEGVRSGPVAAPSFFDRVEQRLRDAIGPGSCVELRAASRILSSALDALRWTERGGIRLGHEVRLPGGRSLDLARRPVLRRVLDALVAARRRAPGSGLGVDEIFEAAWPGERATPSSAANRVYVAVARLRKLGLGPLILTGEQGFYLDPSVPVVDAQPE
ncbi:MAG: hypothetical protein KC619_25835 [Myxococcales bacterium]|nr:hypothetical protein [Myxococcales bacterium]